MGINQQEKGKREKKNQQQTTGRMGRRRGTLKSSRSSRYSHIHANTNEQNQAMGAFPKRPHAVILEARLTGQQTAESPERTHRRDADVTSHFWRLSLRSWEWAQRNASRQGNEKGECHTFQLSRAARGLPASSNKCNDHRDGTLPSCRAEDKVGYTAKMATRSRRRFAVPLER